MAIHRSALDNRTNSGPLGLLIFLATVLFAGVAAAQVDGRVVNKNWNITKFEDMVYLSPRLVDLDGTRRKDYSAADIAVIRKKGLFAIGRERNNPEGTRFIIVGIPQPICRNKAGLTRFFVLPARLEIRVDGRKHRSIKLAAQCGISSIAREADIGSQAFTLITTAFRRGRTANARIMVGNQLILGYEFTLTGFTEAASALERNIF